jgi:hypothetical protein
MMETLLEQRERRLKSPELGIVEPASYVSYAPFDEPRYDHRDIINLGREPWGSMMELHPEAILSPNPFEKSRHRNGFAVWDSAVLPQTAAAEKAGTILSEKPSRLTTENPHMQKLELEFATMVGANMYGNPVRPSGLYVIDLTRTGEMGWLFIEAAHALAHLRCDHMHDSPAFRTIIQKTMCTALASLLHGCLFGVPVYVGKDNAFGTQLAWPRTGFSVSDINNPTLQMRKVGWGSPVPDSACIQALWLYHVEPVPESYITKTVKTGTNDEWSGIPTIMAFAGWDGLDSIIHSRTKISGNAEYHFMHAGDLISPERFVHALELAGWPEKNFELDENWVSVPNWIKSKEFLNLVSETPSIPCRDCYIVNQRTPGAPHRPPEAAEKAWKTYEKGRDECIAIARKAASKYEISAYYMARLPRPKRDVRDRKNAQRRKEFDRKTSDRKKIERIKAKVNGQIKTPLTEKEREMLRAMKKEPK